MRSCARASCAAERTLHGQNLLTNDITNGLKHLHPPPEGPRRVQGYQALEALLANVMPHYRLPPVPSTCIVLKRAQRAQRDDENEVSCGIPRFVSAFCAYSLRRHTRAPDVISNSTVHDLGTTQRLASTCEFDIECQKSRRKGGVIPRCNLQCGFTQPTLRLFLTHPHIFKI